MTLKQQIDQDLKTAMLAKDTQTVSVLRGLKGAVLNVEIQNNSRDTGLTDAEVIAVFTKEAKKRQESAEMYKQGNRPEKAQAEAEEKAIIDKYLPKQLTDEELAQIIDEAIQTTGAAGSQAMGQVMGAVKGKVAGQADGGRIAAMVKEKLA